MEIQLDAIIQDAKNLPLVPLSAISAYQKNIPALIKYVDETLAAEPSINTLIGNNPLQVMYDNHKHHAAFMATVLSVGNYELLARTVPWVYRAYSAHNFSYDYFLLELKAWLDGLDDYLDPSDTPEIQSIYTWMLNKHEAMVALSQSKIDLQLPISEDWLDRKNSFLAAVLEGNHHQCLEIAKKSVSTGKDIEDFYQQIIQPVMYEVGMLWERGTISVAQEHLASAIVGRVMTTVSMADIAPRELKGKAVVTSAPNEFHEIGAWMISDMLENAGWEVRYLGANTPVSDLVEMLRGFQPDVLALSVTMPFNILKAREMITAIRNEQDLNKTRIMIGGRAFNETVDLWRSTGADGFAANIQQAKELADEWNTYE